MRTLVLSCLALLALGCAKSAPAPTRGVPAPVASGINTAPPNAASADDVVARTNAERAKLGLPALAKNENLMRAAQLHAAQMASARRMAHDLPDAKYPTMSTRLAAVGYKMMASGENVAEGHPTAMAVVAGWMTSQGHRENITSTRFTEMGAAVATASNGRPFWVQVFGRPR